MDERESRWALPALVLLGLALRLYGAARAGLTFDESIVWAFAREITVRPVLHLVSRTADHPLLNAYLVRASSLAFGDSDLGLRILHACLGSATIVVVHRLARMLWGVRAGLVAAGLLAVDPFHVSWSRLIIEETPLLLCQVLALLLVWRGLTRGRAADFVWAGVCLGVAYLAKETALLMLPALAVALLQGARGRRALRTPAPYLGLVAALVFVGLDLAWSLGQGSEGHWPRALGILGRPLGLTLKGTSLYLGELYRQVVRPDVLDADYAEGSAYATAWPLGLLYLAGVVVGLRRRQEADRYLLVLFLFVFMAVTLVDGRQMFDPFWWASLSFVPALLLLSRTGDLLCARVRSAPRFLAVALLALALYDTSWLGRPGMRVARFTRQEWAAKLAGDAEERRARGDLETARDQARQAVLMDADNASARDLLARLP
jgi:4-amino-4-deoxy-L-arabinose transferase-like glycosyltransferase